jgi:hypothetical protein
MFTLTERLPKILDQVVERNDLSAEEAAPMEELKTRLHSGRVKDCLAARAYLRDRMEAAEYEAWSREIAKHAGKTWLDLPWYFAESLFYLEVLLAWGYYTQDSPRFSTDPFRPFKEEELHRPGGALDLAERIHEETSGICTPVKKLPVLLRFGLWANQLDLSYSQLLEKSRNRSKAEANRLLVDHSALAAEELLQARRVDVVLDNSASELVGDLHLAHSLLQPSTGRTVILHCKKAPFYVSDAVIRDVSDTINCLKQSQRSRVRRFGEALFRALEQGSLRLRDHYFWNGPLHFPEFPDDLRQELAESDLVVLKGDLNYRRLLCDRKWPPWTDMESIVAYFPAALAVLRTTKSELNVDLPRETVDALNQVDPNWSVEGQYGIIRYCNPRS